MLKTKRIFYFADSGAYLYNLHGCGEGIGSSTSSCLVNYEMQLFCGDDYYHSFGSGFGSGSSTIYDIGRDLSHIEFEYFNSNKLSLNSLTGILKYEDCDLEDYGVDSYGDEFWDYYQFND